MASWWSDFGSYAQSTYFKTVQTDRPATWDQASCSESSSTARRKRGAPEETSVQRQHDGPGVRVGSVLEDSDCKTR
ncbi:hypothetical protein E4U52_006506 [Claviceps spartinae]|nr:hypothetical protein E4U52_006506 [Claviceps spartinae]